MNEYQVTVSTIITAVITVEAESQEEAETEARHQGTFLVNAQCNGVSTQGEIDHLDVGEPQVDEVEFLGGEEEDED